MHIKLCIATFVLILSLNACKTTKNLRTDTAIGRISEKDVLEKIKEKSFDFNFLNSNLDLSLDSEEFTGSVKGKLRIIKDSIIWLSLSKFGFEGGRIMITTDSLFVIERIQKTYVRQSIKEASQQIEFDINFNMIQDFLLGQPFLGSGEIEMEFSGRDSLTISPKIENFLIDHFVNLTNFEINHSRYESIRDGILVELSFEEYEEIQEGTNFSYFRTFKIFEQGGSQAQGSVKFEKPELNIEKSIIFSIPKHYTEREL